MATNKEGETTGENKLSVYSEAPTFSTKPKSCYAKAGQTAKFEGCVQGIPLASTISWQKADEVIVKSERFKMESTDEGTFSLTISDVQETDYAEYTAKAISAVGENSAAAELTLTSDPAALLGNKLPVATKVDEGESLKLSLKVGGKSLAGSQMVQGWQGAHFRRADDHHFATGWNCRVGNRFSPFWQRFRPVYKMVAVNPTDKVSSETTVDVKKKPKKGTIDEALEELQLQSDPVNFDTMYKYILFQYI